MTAIESAILSQSTPTKYSYKWEVQEEIFYNYIVRGSYRNLSEIVNYNIAEGKFNHKNEKGIIFRYLKELEGICKVSAVGRMGLSSPWGEKGEIRTLCQSFNWKLNQIAKVMRTVGVKIDEVSYGLDPDTIEKFCNEMAASIFEELKKKKFSEVEKEEREKTEMFVGEASRKVGCYNRRFFGSKSVQVTAAIREIESLIEEYSENPYILKSELRRLKKTVKSFKSKLSFLFEHTRLTEKVLDSFIEDVLNVEKSNRQIFWDNSYNKRMREESEIEIEDDEQFTPSSDDFVERHFFDEDEYIGEDGSVLDVKPDKILIGAKKEIDEKYLDALKKLSSLSVEGYFAGTFLESSVDRILDTCRYAYETDEWTEEDKNFVEQNIFKIHGT